MRRSLIAALVLSLIAPRVLQSQERGATALRELVDGLSTTVRVLMIGAHPDDEDTQLIAWLSRGRHVETAYLSLTRGDGGQNLIGNELGEALGVLRTEELLAARRIDGARQYFTRAYDFGFSKSAEETFRHWPKDSLLRDVVRVVREFRPHIIVSVFSGTPRDGHGQHQAAGILAREAFDLAGDSTYDAPSRTGDVRSWRPRKFYRSAWFARETATLRINVGEYSPLLGRSYAEIAGESRSQHKSQAFGALQRKGVVWDHVRLEASNVAGQEPGTSERSFFDGIDTTWSRLAGMPFGVDGLTALIRSARDAVHAGDDELAARLLARLASRASAIEAGMRCRGSSCSQYEGDIIASVRRLRDLASRAALIAAAVDVEATVQRQTFAVGDTVAIDVAVYNRGRAAVGVMHAHALEGVELRTITNGVRPSTVDPDSVAHYPVTARAHQHSYPPWLADSRRGDLYFIVENDWDGAARLRVAINIGEESVETSVPVIHRFADPVRGEVRRPVAIVGPVTIRLERAIELVPADSAFERVFRVELRSGSDQEQSIRLVSVPPPGTTVRPIPDVTLPPHARRTVDIRLRGQLPRGTHRLGLVGQSGSLSYTSGYSEIAYDHIRPQRIYRHSELALHAVNIRVPKVAVAYIAGVGDNILPSLRQLGVRVTEIDPDDIAGADLSRYATIVIGPRAYESKPALVAANARLLDWVRGGGRLVVQYGQYEMMRPGMMPFPLVIARPHDRVTDENAPVRMLGGSVLRTPNGIGPRDWHSWVQERSLYMPRSFDPRYVPVLEMHDPGEEPSKGALLIAKYGQGTYVYTTLSFFRQLPAGITGAARLFMNLLVAQAAP